jgi:hypothetical protein
MLLDSFVRFSKDFSGNNVTSSMVAKWLKNKNKFYLILRFMNKFNTEVLIHHSLFNKDRYTTKSITIKNCKTLSNKNQFCQWKIKTAHFKHQQFKCGYFYMHKAALFCINQI